MKNKKIILHLCADTGSDTKPYQNCPNEYKVIRVGKDIGIENFDPPKDVYGIIANPPCTEFSTARSDGKARNPEIGMELVKQCQRIINNCKPKFWVIENPARGVLKNYLGRPKYEYEPWWYGSPWTKRTALWGNFNIPPRLFYSWDDVAKNPKLYIRPNTQKPSLALLHKSAFDLIDEFKALPRPETDMEFRSLCSQKFANQFYLFNR